MNIRAQKRAQAAPFGTLILGDNQTARVRITVPRMDNNVDLSDLTWLVHVTNAEGQTDVVQAQDVNVDNSDIVMSVIVGGVATAAVGNTRIMIEGVNDGGSVWRSAEYYLRIDDAGTAEPSEDDEQRLTALQELMLYVEGNLNAVIEAGEKATEAYQHPPVIGENGNWFIWDWEMGVYADSGKPSQGSGGGGGIAQETDPTVPAWAKQPKKPTYTAEEVGAASKEDVKRLSEEKADYFEVGDGLQMSADRVLSAVGGSEGKYELIRTIVVEGDETGSVVFDDMGVLKDFFLRVMCIGNESTEKGTLQITFMERRDNGTYNGFSSFPHPLLETGKTMYASYWGKAIPSVPFEFQTAPPSQYDDLIEPVYSRPYATLVEKGLTRINFVGLGKIIPRDSIFELWGVRA